ncbi:phosphatase PAP2 family protein [Streptomyces sp. NPDC088910]|uniref:phosphatase PAP2 family protein n=1 Tax=Streptomyces sp. NPDC088910 TaxID=3365911 RepID=UPI00381ED92A
MIPGLVALPVTYGLSRTPRSGRPPKEITTGDTAPVYPQHRLSSALAHDTAGTVGPGTPRRSVGRSSHTPRDERHGGRPGRPGTLPPVPGRLTFLLLLSAVGAALFSLLTWQVETGGRLVGRDWTVLGWFRRASAAHPGVHGTAQVVSDFGDIEVAVPVLLVAVVAAAVLGLRAAVVRWWLPPLAACVAMALLPVVVDTVKSAVHRPAPGRLLPRLDGYGYFPSGHAATSAVAYGLALLLLLPYVRRPAARTALTVFTLALQAAVGVALVWCDYHWPLDVLASWFLTVTLVAWVAAAGLFSHAPEAGEPDADGPDADGPTVSYSSGSPD